MTSPPSEHSLILPAVVDIAGADAVRSDLLRAARDEARVVLDASRVRRIDTAGLQVLAAFFREARRDGRTVRWESPPANLREAARLLGLQAVLNLE